MPQLRIFFRRLGHDRLLTIITICGLITGISAFLVLFIHVMNERQFDKHFQNSEDIYRILSSPAQIDQAPWARSLGIVNLAADNIPGIELATQFTHCDGGRIRIGERSMEQDHIMSVDEVFIQMFGVESKIGDLRDLKKPNTVFISENFAKKYFGDEDPVGQQIHIDALQYLTDLGPYEIRGILRNTNPRTHFKYELLISQKGKLQERYESLPDRKIAWTYNYYRLSEGMDPAMVAGQLKAFYDNSSLKSAPGPREYVFSLFPLEDIHLMSDCRFELRERTSSLNIPLFMLISIVILMVTLLNFTNLSVAKILKRSREFGLKKTLGSGNSRLVWQVLGEVFMLCSVSIIISLTLIELFRPLMNRMFAIEFDIYYHDPMVPVILLLMLLSCLALSALFVTGFLLSKNSTIDILSGKVNFSGSVIMRILLMLQVAVVMMLISGTLVVNKQVHFMLDKPLGFNEEQVVVLHLKDLAKDPMVFVRALETQNAVTSVGMTAQHFGYPAQAISLENFGLEGTAEFVFANYSYLQTMGIQLLHNWIPPNADTVRGMVVNEHLYKRLMERHGSMEALQTFRATQSMEEGQQPINFVGVAADFNYSSAHETIGDFAFWLDESANRARFTHIRMKPGNLLTAMETIRNIWEQHYPGQELSYFFLDEKIASQYASEILLRKVLLVFSIAGILICLLGMSAMALFIARQRTREIGIRKVNGASITRVLVLLNKDFVKWCLLAFVPAIPLIYYAMSRWLENFAYRSALNWWIFALAGFIVLVITVFTVSLQSYHSASMNPVDALRHE
ncbi:ABC transporter permease [Bacteroidota bacterium]